MKTLKYLSVLALVVTVLPRAAMAIPSYEMVCAEGKVSVAKASIRRSVLRAAKKAGVKLQSVEVTLGADISRPTKTVQPGLVDVSLSVNPLSVVVESTTFDFNSRCEIKRNMVLSVTTKQGESSTTIFPITLEGVYVKK